MYSFCLFAKPHFASCPQVTFPLSHFLTTSRTLQNTMKKDFNKNFKNNCVNICISENYFVSL